MLLLLIQFQSHNISARQIRDEADVRRQRAARSQPNGGEEAVVAESSATAAAREDSEDEVESARKTRKRKEESKAIEKIKSSKAFKKRKKHEGADDDYNDDELARAIFEERHAPLPGQMENCDICDKRFTVTPYSVAGPNGGLLCAPCGRQIAKEREGQKPKPKKPRKQTGGIGSRRVVQSRILDGDIGTKSLATLCVETLAKNVDMADSLGDLPEHLVDKIARIFSKRRLLKPETLPLFVQPITEKLYIYDGAKLGDQEFMSIFQTAPKLRHFKARSAIQFKDEVMDYLLSRDTTLESFYLHGANLLSEEKWHEFFHAKGQELGALQVYYTDRHFGDDTITELKQSCPNLKRLKIEGNQKLTSTGVQRIGELAGLERLGLQLINPITSSSLSTCVRGIGSTLKTLSFKDFPSAEDGVLQDIHGHCKSLEKLRITHSEAMTDDGFVRLFTNWPNPPLHDVDLQKCRHMDATNPRGNPDSVGLCGEGFKALMAHSGQRLQKLNIHACRNIPRKAFEEVFNDKATYPELRWLEISFCEEVTDFILGSIFRACPKIREVNVFGCMKVRNIRAPRGVILVGVPNAQVLIFEGMD